MIQQVTEIRSQMIQLINQSKLPTFVIDGILSDVLSEIRNQEMIEITQEVQNDDNNS